MNFKTTKTIAILTIILFAFLTLFVYSANAQIDINENNNKTIDDICPEFYICPDGTKIEWCKIKKEYNSEEIINTKCVCDEPICEANKRIAMQNIKVKITNNGNEINSGSYCVIEWASSSGNC